MKESTAAAKSKLHGQVDRLKEETSVNTVLQEQSLNCTSCNFIYINFE